uniref:Uncharacterized protein n=1 Tax=Oryza punctata TaxID=4537 RepID=A0A1V1H903_ORYPU|nr:hypothetical protein [Oryza punctata]BAX24918.1 hypothetical protein [Oryza punctata]
MGVFVPLLWHGTSRSRRHPRYFLSGRRLDLPDTRLWILAQLGGMRFSWVSFGKALSRTSVADGPEMTVWTMYGRESEKELMEETNNLLFVNRDKLLQSNLWNGSRQVEDEDVDPTAEEYLQEQAEYEDF